MSHEKSNIFSIKTGVIVNFNGYFCGLTTSFMPSKTSVQNAGSKGKKKKKSKRVASSPLDDNGCTGNLNGGITTSQQRKRRQGEKNY